MPRKGRKCTEHVPKDVESKSKKSCDPHVYVENQDDDGATERPHPDELAKTQRGIE